MRVAVVRGVLALSVALVFAVPHAEATITFRPGTPIDLSNDLPGDGVQAIAVADLNKDGYADILVVRSSSGTVGVYLNDGNGGFPAESATLSATDPVAVTTGDFNHDGNLDVAIVNNFDDTVTVYLGDGAGNFNSPRDWPVDSSPVGVVAADLNGDLRDDLAVLSDSTVHLLKANSDGTFTDFNPASISTGRFTSGGFAIAAGRISNSHNYVDLAVSSADSDTVSVLLGNNDGTFQSASVLSSGLSNPQGLAIGEFDGDTIPDIAVISGPTDTPTVLILSQDANGAFTAHDTASESTAEIGAVALEAVDLDGDGRTDLVVGSVLTGESPQIELYCQEPTSCAQGGVCSALCYQSPVDFSHPNSVIANFQIQGVLGANGLTGSVSALQSGDLNSDGRPDLVAVDIDNDAIKVWFNTTGQVVQPTTPPTSASNTPGATATPTPIVPTSTPTQTLTPLPTATPTPIPTAPYGVCNTNEVPALGNLGKPVAVVTGDFNHDGNQDIVVADNAGGRIALLLSHPTSAATDACGVLRLTSGDDVTGVSAPVALAAALPPADLNHDSNPDLVVVGSKGLSVFFGNGAGGFKGDVDNPMTAGTNPQAVAIADFNHDGWPDIIVANRDSSNVSVFFNLGDETFSNPCQIPVGRNADLVVARDLNSDGLPDFAVASRQTNDVVIFLQAGSSATPTPGSVPTCSSPNGPVTFMSLSAISLPQQPQAIVFDNFDPTNVIPDFAVVASPSVGGGVVQISLGSSPSGAGLVYASTRLPVPTPTAGATGQSAPSAIGSGDINRDSRPDLIVADRNNNDVVIYLANSDGSFTKSLIPFVVPGQSPVALTVADIDGDGIPDIVTANQGDGSVTILVSSRPPPTPTPLPTDTPTATGTPTLTGTPTETPTPTPSITATATVTGTRLPTLTPVPSPVPTETIKPGTITLQGSSCAVDPASRHHDWGWVSVSMLLLAARFAQRRKAACRGVK